MTDKGHNLARIALGFDDFGWEAVVETAERHGLGVGELIAAGCRRYMAEAAGGPPSFARAAARSITRTAKGSLNERVQRQVTVDLGPGELSALEDEAARYRVSLGTLVRHAVFVLLADIESGRVSAELAAETTASVDAI